MPGVLEAVEAGEIKISTVHNFCPLPIGLNHAAPNIFKFTSPDARERDNALRHTLKSLDTAQRVGAQLVVLHLGAIDMRLFTDRLLGMVGAGEKEAPKYQRLCAACDEMREAKKEEAVERAYQMLRTLEPEAKSRGLLLGVENREALEEIPLESDFPFLFREFNSGAIRYWHDTGHAQIKQNLGFIDHLMHLESVADQLAGFHVHDVGFPGEDHEPPGKGTVDFAALKGLVKPEHIKVFELGPDTTTADLQAGVAHLKAIWGEA
jgi:sugar phosphate isomerase/epimerase